MPPLDDVMLDSDASFFAQFKNRLSADEICNCEAEINAILIRYNLPLVFSLDDTFSVTLDRDIVVG